MKIANDWANGCLEAFDRKFKPEQPGLSVEQKAHMLDLIEDLTEAVSGKFKAGCVARGKELLRQNGRFVPE